MSTKPTRPRDEDDEVTPYGVTHEAPHVPPPISYPVDDDELLPPEEDAPRKKKKRKKRPDGFGEVAGHRRDRLLERDEGAVSAVPWWAEAAVAAFFGAVPTLLVVVLVAANAKQANLALGVFLGLGVGVAVLVQTAAVTAFLFVVGNLFGIDYGPVKEAVVKLAATVIFVNGVTLFGMLQLCVPVGLVVGALSGFPVFWRLFKLGLQETLLSVTLIALPACVLAAALFALQVTKAQGG